MDTSKCTALKQDFAGQEEPQIVHIDRFFDGNDDTGSIGCNLVPHPGLDAFRHAFTALGRRSDVQAIYAQITELDPGEDSWPFTDTVLVVGSISPEALKEALASLEPDDVGTADPDSFSPGLSDSERQSALVAWWD